MGKVYIDGENFMFKVANILKANKLIEEKSDIMRFKGSYLRRRLAREDRVSRVSFYYSKLHIYNKSKTIQDKSKALIQSQRRLKRYMEDDGVNFIASGKVQMHEYKPDSGCHCEKAAFKEKGVDVRLAVDILADVYHGRAKTVFLVSSDSDMMPVVREARKCGAVVIYAGFATNPNKGLMALCNKAILFSDEEIIEAYRQANKNAL